MSKREKGLPRLDRSAGVGDKIRESRKGRVPGSAPHIYLAIAKTSDRGTWVS